MPPALPFALQSTKGATRALLAFFFVGTLPVPYPASSFGDFAGRHQPPGQSPVETHAWAEPWGSLA